MSAKKIVDSLLDRSVKVELLNKAELNELNNESDGNGEYPDIQEPEGNKNLLSSGRIIKIDDAIAKIEGVWIHENYLIEDKEVKVSILGDGRVNAYFESKIRQIHFDTQKDDDSKEVVLVIDMPDEDSIINVDARQSIRKQLEKYAYVKYLSYRGEFLPKDVRRARKEEILDVSKTGVKLSARFNVRPGMRANLQFKLGEYKIDVSADVVWVEKQDGFFVCGLEFINLEKSQARIIGNWVNYHK